MWVDVLGKSVVSAHPLGGCTMGESGRAGVVNHAGQVFDGKDIAEESRYGGIILPTNLNGSCIHSNYNEKSSLDNEN